MNEDAVLDAIQEFVAATDALHVIHGSTNVHPNAYNAGYPAGAAMTPHCGWACDVVGVHDAERDRVYQARRRLQELGLI